MITIPAIILNGNELLNRNLPKKVADAPKIINTIENPTVNKIIGNKLIFFFPIVHLKNFQRYMKYSLVLKVIHMVTKNLLTLLQKQ